MISDERAEKAVEFIRDNAARHGQLKAAVSFHEYKARRVRSEVFLALEGPMSDGRKPTASDRDAVAMSAPSTLTAYEELRDVIAEEQMVRDQIQAAELTIEVWRTQAANQRRGNI